MVKNRSNKSLHHPHSCHFNQALVRAKMYPLLREKRSSCCGESSSKTCLNIKEINTFQSFVIKKIYKINYHCDSKCALYFLSCKLCNLQYVGSTIDRYRLRQNNYKHSHRVALEGGTLQHFLCEDHHGLLEDCEIRFIDKTDSSDPTRTEFFWIYELKTFPLLGLNICDIVEKAIFGHFLLRKLFRC